MKSVTQKFSKLLNNSELCYKIAKIVSLTFIITMCVLILIQVFFYNVHYSFNL